MRGGALAAVMAAVLGGCGPSEGTGREEGRFGLGDGGRSSSSSSGGSSTSGGWTSSGGGSSSSSGWVSSSSGGSSTSSSSSSGGTVDAGIPVADDVGCPADPLFATPIEVTHALAATGGRLLVLQPAPHVLRRSGGTWEAAGELPAGLAVAVLADGRWVVGRQDELVIERKAVPRPLPVARLSTRMIADGNALLVPSTEGAWSVDADVGPGEHTAAPRVFCSPAAVARWNGALVVAAPDWPATMARIDDVWQALAEHGLFTNATRHAPDAWTTAPSRRVLLPFGADLADVPSFGMQSRLLVHHAGGTVTRVNLPAGSYRAGTWMEPWLVFAALQPGGQDALVVVDSIDLQAAPPVSTVFTGPVLGLASVEGALFALVADALHEFRVEPGAITLVATHAP